MTSTSTEKSSTPRLVDWAIVLSCVVVAVVASYELVTIGGVPSIINENIKSRLNRFEFDALFGLVSSIALVLSILCRFVAAGNPQSKKRYGTVIVGLWVILPPLFFWFDWLIYFDEIKKVDHNFEATKVTYELNRNIWLALIPVLCAIYGIQPLGKQEP